MSIHSQFTDENIFHSIFELLTCENREAEKTNHFLDLDL